jgi:hypothetical protein
MSLIPSSAIGAAFVAVQRSANELARARKLQSDKDNHHHQEVEELDETAVNSVDDNSEGNENRRREEGAPRKRAGDERVEIAYLKEVPAVAAKKGAARRLDIAA